MIEVLTKPTAADPPAVWFDIENPPQVQYLLPLRQQFEAAGLRTLVTARDYGSTLSMLESAGVPARVFGTRVGRGKLRKVAAVAHRAYELQRFLTRTDRPCAVIHSSRSTALAAWRLGIRSFVISDYEHAHGRVYAITGSTLVFPDVIDPMQFCRKGFRADRLLPFKGIKEDLTFTGVDVDAIVAHDLGPLPPDAVRVLFRPPSETSHYYREESTTMARATLEWLAAAGALVVFSPREPEQVALLEGLPWRYEPITLTRAVPFVSLLKSVDSVVCSGGTMLREAAYLGIPAYSIFQSEIGAVDRWLESIGRARLIERPEDVSCIKLKHRGPIDLLDSNPNLLSELASAVVPGSGDRPRATASV